MLFISNTLKRTGNLGIVLSLVLVFVTAVVGFLLSAFTLVSGKVIIIFAGFMVRWITFENKTISIPIIIWSGIGLGIGTFFAWDIIHSQWADTSYVGFLFVNSTPILFLISAGAYDLYHLLKPDLEKLKL